MHRALALAETVRGRTSPNPAVGAVILDADGHARRRGRHRARRRPARRGRAPCRRPARDARGGTAVVTLEPCAHTGRTGAVHRRADRRRHRQGRLRRRRPESRGRRRRASAARGRRRVVAGVEDARRGERRAAAVAARGAHRPAVRHLEVRRHPRRPGGRRRPHLALDLLGRLARRRARAAGRRRRDPGRQRHRARRRPAADRARRRRRWPTTSRCASSSTAGTASRTRRRVLDDAAETLVLDTAVPRFALKALYDRGVRHVLLEGGPTLAGAFVEARCVDEVVAYLAPTLLGAGPAALGDAGIGTLADAVTLDVESVTRLGDDVKIVARPALGRAGDRRVAAVGAAVFTGIIEEIGEVAGIEPRGDSAVLTIARRPHRRRPRARRVDRGQRRLPDRRRLARTATAPSSTSTSWARR